MSGSSYYSTLGDVLDHVYRPAPVHVISHDQPLAHVLAPEVKKYKMLMSGSSYYSTLGDVLDHVYRPVIVPVTGLAPRPSPLSLSKTPLAPRPSPPLIQNCLIAIFVHETGEFAKNRKINVTINTQACFI